MQHHLILPAGSIPSENCAIASVRLTKGVNTGENLTFGSVCSAMAEITLLCEDPEAIPKAGSAFTLEQETDTGERKTLGRFYVEKPQSKGYGTWYLTGYDPVRLLDREVTKAVEAITAWPCTLRELVKTVCDFCDVPVAADTLEQGDFLVKKVKGLGYTGRQILQWAGEISGQFCTANPEGILEFGWFTPKGITLTPGGTYYYYGRSLQLQDFTVPKVRKVVLRQTASDVGTAYPAAGEGETYSITGNGLLSPDSAAELEKLAAYLYEKLRDISYTPCSLEIPAHFGVQPGDVIGLMDTMGKTHTVYITEAVTDRFRQKLTACGSFSREKSAVTNYKQVIGGRVLELETAVEGLRAENRDAQGNLARLLLTVSGVESTVEAVSQTQSQLQTAVTSLRQEAEGLSLSVKTLEQGATKVTTETGYTFNEQGLRIRKQGQEMENLLDNTGMYVNRGQDVILRANDQGVQARDVQALNYLIVGDHARLEDYTAGGENRTACFYVN